MWLPQVLIYCLFIILSLVGAPFGQNWDHDVYTGRQFNSLILNSTEIDDDVNDNIVKTSALLIIYESACLDKLKQQKIQQANIPPARYLAFAKYNYRVAEDRVWYNMDDDDDLRDRYGYVECPDVIFLPKGGTVDRPVPWIQGEPFLEWIWRQYHVDVEVKNVLLDAIEVDIQGPGPKVPQLVIEPGAYRRTELYISYTLIVKRKTDGKLLYCMVLDVIQRRGTTLQIDINRALVKQFEDKNETEWLEKIRTKQATENLEIISKRKEMASMYALGLKQPLLLPKFTDNGFELHDYAEEEFYKTLSSYYFNQKKSYTSMRLEPALNTDEVSVKTVKLNDTAKDIIVRALQPKLEEWASCKLTLTEYSGILISHGSFIRPHIGNIDSQVISVLLMLDSNDSWELDVIDFNGERVDISLKPGTALLYESSTVSHSSKLPFQGTNGALLYVHFKPRQQWNWSKNAENITNGNIQENIFKLDSPTTKRENWKNNIFTKWSDIVHKDMHDEL